MQRPAVARIGASARPVVSVTYWTADAEGSSLIEAWLGEETDRPLPFYGSFINWCSQQSDRVKNPYTKFPSEEHEQKALDVREVLREDPLDTGGFIGLMQDYLRWQYGSGFKSGNILRPEDEGQYQPVESREFVPPVLTLVIDTLELQKGQKELAWVV